jgi:hypothetical protein
MRQIDDAVSTGLVMIDEMRISGTSIDRSIVVFALRGNLILLGAIGLEGLNLRVGLARNELIPAGPLPVAASFSPESLHMLGAVL